MANPASAKTILTLPGGSLTHVGGQLAFGPLDQYLYVSHGDRNWGLLRDMRMQQLDNLYGKLLRIDVDSAVPYAIPADNPFVGVGGARGEIWSYGLRNPWRFSFDRATGEMYIGDVGTWWEEVNYAPALIGGQNYGWPLADGAFWYTDGFCTDDPCLAFTNPVFSYRPGALIGGHVFRGCRGGPKGSYLYADFLDSKVQSFQLIGGSIVLNHRDWSSAFSEVSRPSSFGEDARGDLYILNYSDGAIHLITK